MNHKFIAFEGTIGVGKTTLARRLQPHFQAEILLEVFEENPFLPQFYADRERYAFQTQIFFLLSRYHQQHQAVPQALRRSSLLADYTFGKDEIFAWLNLKDDELAMYGRVHAALSEKLVKPDLIVYLVADTEVLLRRIALRDRPYERNMDPGYIQDVANAYDAWLSNLHDPPVLKIDTNHLDFLAREEDLQYIAGLIETSLARQAEHQVLADKPLALPRHGSLTAYQQFHRQLAASPGSEADLLLVFAQLSEQMGELAGELVRAWVDGRQRDGNGRQQPTLRRELADMLAQLLNLANRAGIDLEEAYRERIQSSGPEQPSS